MVQSIANATVTMVEDKFASNNIYLIINRTIMRCNESIKIFPQFSGRTFLHRKIWTIKTPCLDNKDFK